MKVKLLQKGTVMTTHVNLLTLSVTTAVGSFFENFFSLST